MQHNNNNISLSVTKKKRHGSNPFLKAVLGYFRSPLCTLFVNFVVDRASDILQVKILDFVTKILMYFYKLIHNSFLDIKTIVTW